MNRIASTSMLVLMHMLMLAAALPAAAADNPQIERGREVYQHWCSACHAAGDHGFPGTLALAAKYQGTSTPAALEQRRDLSLPVLRHFVRNGVSIMPFFRKTEISDADIEAMAAYLAQSAR